MTLELALAGVPMVVAYRVDPIVLRLFKPFLQRSKSIVLANLILGTNAIPEFLDGECDAGAAGARR